MIKVLIADDHAIVRKGLKQLIIEEYPSAVVGEADDAESLSKRISSKPWDVVICDLNMPGRSGLDALKQIKQSFPHIPVLIMSMYPAEQYAIRALKGGASGYLSKDSIHDELMGAVRAILSGRKFITPLVAEILLNDFSISSNQPPHMLLSDREFEVLRLLGSGMTNTQIASKLSLSKTTVSTFRARILKKITAKSNVEIARYVIEHGLI